MTSEAILGVTALVVTMVAAWYTIRIFFMKVGTRLRGSFTITSSVSCADQYVSSITIQNQKDRAVVVFKAYLHIQHGYYIELDNFEKNPLILKPFEVWHREYEPIEMYTVSSKRINLNRLLAQNSYKRMRLVLATAEGKYLVREWIQQWDPIIDFFKNRATAIVQTRRAIFEGKSYGSNARYVVQFRFPDGKDEAVPIYDSDYSIKKFRKFRLTQESLRTKEALEEFLLEQAVAGVLPCRDLTVHDLDIWRKDVYERQRNKPTIIAKPQSWFAYYVVGSVITRWEDWKLRRANRAALRLQ